MDPEALSSSFYKQEVLDDATFKNTILSKIDLLSERQKRELREKLGMGISFTQKGIAHQIQSLVAATASPFSELQVTNIQAYLARVRWHGNVAAYDFTHPIAIDEPLHIQSPIVCSTRFIVHDPVRELACVTALSYLGLVIGSGAARSCYGCDNRTTTTYMFEVVQCPAVQKLQLNDASVGIYSGMDNYKIKRSIDLKPLYSMVHYCPRCTELAMRRTPVPLDLKLSPDHNSMLTIIVVGAYMLKEPMFAGVNVYPFTYELKDKLVKMFVKSNKNKKFIKKMNGSLREKFNSLFVLSASD